MMNLNDLLTDSHNDDMNDEELLQYLEGKLSPEEKHAFEKKMIDSAFVNDAIEGLEAFTSKQHLNEQVLQLNRQLQQQLHARKARQKKRAIKDIPAQMLYVIIVLLLCILGYLVIYLLKHHG